MPNAEKHLAKGQKAVPALKYAYALIGIAGAATTIASYFTSPYIAIAAIILTLVGMNLVWLFSRLTSGDAKDDPATRVMVWSSIAVFVLGVALLINLVVWRKPAYLADLMGLPMPVQPPSEEEQQKIGAIIGAGVVDPTKIDPRVREDHKFAQIFIDGATFRYCEKSTDAEMKKKFYCISQTQIIAALPAPQHPPPPPIAPQSRVAACANTALAKVGQPPQKIFGIDVTNHNGQIDWAKVVADGYYFVFIRATQGTSFVDAKFKANWDDAGKAGLIRGAYHFLGAADGREQADFFLRTLNTVTMGPCDLGTVLDLEKIVSGDEPAPAVRLEQALSWLKTVEDVTRRTPYLYSGFYLRQLGDPMEFAKYPLWLAQYTSEPKLPRSHSHYVFWQFSDGAAGPRLAPVPYRFDMNIFNGSATELFALTQ